MTRSKTCGQSSILEMTFRPLTLLCCAFLGETMTTRSFAEGGSGIQTPPRISGTMEQEIQKRLSHSQDAAGLIERGDALMISKDYAGAMEQFRSAISLLPDAPMTVDLRNAAKLRFAQASIQHAGDLGRIGKFAEANAILDAVLDLKMLPDHEGAKTLKEQLKDPDRFNPAMTLGFHEKVTKVNRLLEIASGFIDLGDFKAAEAAYNQILSIDPHNSAARRGMEKCTRLTRDYHMASRDHTRTKALTEIDRLWETAVPDVSFVPKLPNAMAAPLSAGYTTKLRGIIFPKVNFEGATLSEVVQFLASKSRELDLAEPNPEKRGINMLVKIPQAEQAKLLKIDLDLTEIPLYQLLDFVAERTGTRWKLNDGLISFSSVAVANSKMNIRMFSVPPGFLSSAPASETTTAPVDPFAAADTPAASGNLAVSKLGAQAFLESSGIPFPQGSSASFDRGSSRLIVTNTDENLDLVQTLVDQMGTKATKQARIRVTIMRINETHLNELGFDWLLGQFDIGKRLFGSGGTFGNQGTPAFPALDYPFLDPQSSASSFIPTAQLPLTGGLRSSPSINDTPSIESLLQLNRNTAQLTNKTAGVFGLAGAFTDPQFQFVMRALNQKKSTDLLNSTEVVVRSGQIAKAKAIRELIYPSDYDPAQIPQSTGAVNAAPVTPASPASFTMREVGNLLEVEATIAEDGSSVDLRMAPQFTELVGFINYGNTINTFQGITPIELTRNLIVQPVFDTIRTSDQTSVTVYDGNTIAFGGLTQSRVSEINDKVPILGDVPLIGRLFRTSVKESTRTVIVLFVTVNVQDPAGRPLRAVQEDPSLDPIGQ